MSDAESESSSEGYQRLPSHIAIGITEDTEPGEPTEFLAPSPRYALEREILVQVLFAGINPLSLWEIDSLEMVGNDFHIFGGAIVGRVIHTGWNIMRVKPGDMVMGYTWKRRVERALQEYAIIPDNNFCIVPDNISLPLAATIPDGFVTAWHTLISVLKLPMMEMTVLFKKGKKEEKEGDKEDGFDDAPETSFLIWGGETYLGLCTIQLLRFAGYRNIMTTAPSKHTDLLHSFGALHVFSNDSPTVVDDIRDLTLNGKVDIVLDCIADEEKSLKPISEVVMSGSRVGILMPVRSVGEEGVTFGMKPKTTFPDGVMVAPICTDRYLKDDDLDPITRATLQPLLMEHFISCGNLKPGPVRMVEGETFFERVKGALDLLRKGEASGERLVVQVAENLSWEDEEDEDEDEGFGGGAKGGDDVKGKGKGKESGYEAEEALRESKRLKTDVGGGGGEDVEMGE